MARYRFSMARSPTETLRRFELDVAATAPVNRQNRELHILGSLNALEVVLTQRIAEVVQACREQGASWSQIAAILRVSKQAAHERYGHRRPASAVPAENPPGGR